MLEDETKIKFINEKLAQLKTYIKLNSHINLNDICVISEDFFCKLLNSIFGYKLINANVLENNFKGIDLIDTNSKIVFQITADDSADKIQTTINKFQAKFNNSYKLKFIIISDKKRFNKVFNIESGYAFDKRKDILFIEDFSQLSRKNLDEVYNIIENDFFGENIERKYEWYEKNNRNNIEDLGCRYNKEIDITTETYRKLENFLCDEEFLNKVLLDIKGLIYSLMNFEERLVKKESMQKFKVSYSEFIKEMKIIEVNKLYCVIEDIQGEISQNEQSVIEKLVGENNDVYREKKKIYEILEQCQKCKEYLELMKKGVLIVTGNMGTGKSHIVASYIENKCFKNKNEAILILGQHLNDNKLFKLQIKEILEINENFERFIKLLDAKGKEKNIFIPIFIDAINESLYNMNWKNELNGIISIIKEYKYVKLIITLRTDYTKLCLPENMENEFVERIQHNGFQDEEDIYSIINEIFHYYGVPIPLFPMINDEYTNPLFIISFCKLVRDYKIDILIQNYTSFRTIFEKYISMINERLSRRFNYNVENHLLDEVIKNIVEYMVEKSKLYITQKEFCTIEKDLLQNYGIAPIKLIDILRSEGLIFKSIYAKDEIIYFSYDQYNSILKADLLFEKVKDGNKLNVEKLKSLIMETMDSDVLKNIFILIGNEYGIEIYDLFDFSKDVDNDFKIINAYMLSLLWRKKDNFDKNLKFKLFINIINEKYTWLISDYNDLFYYCASIEDSPFNIYYYNEQLKKMSLAERDFKYTIRLNFGIATRMALYCLKADMKGLNSNSRIMLAITLSWFLASPNRYLRDISTKALVNLLTDNIETMIKLIENFKNVDDLYIMERVYASCYGAVLRSDNTKKLEELLDIVYQNVFDIEEVTPNIIVRYYAKNLILYGKFKGMNIEFDLNRIYAPYNSKWYEVIPTNDEIKSYKIDYKKINKNNRYLYAQNEIIDSMLTEDAKELGMYGDFGRYYFGANISEWKQNFPSEQILSNIAIKRIFDFGYDVEKFGNYDMWQRERCGYDRHEHRFERIGKKYQWLALYEIIAKLQDNYKYLKGIDNENEKEEKGISYYNWKGEEVSFSKATYKEQIYEECNPFLLNIDVTNLIELPKVKFSQLKMNIDKKWFKEDLSNIQDIIENGEFISLNVSKRLNKKTLELCENKGLCGDYKYDSQMTVVYQAYLYRNKLDLNESEKEGMFRGIYSSNDLLLLEYPWKYKTIKEFNEQRDNCYITNYDYSYNSEYDMTEEDTSGIIQPSRYIIDLLELKQGNDGYWYDNNNKVVCYDTILENGESEFIIKKDCLIEVLKKNNLKIMWMGYVEKKYKDNLREYRFRIDRTKNGLYNLTEKWSEKEWKYQF